MRFDAAAIAASADGRSLPVAASLTEDGAVLLDIAIPASVLAGGAVEIALTAPHALPFSELDASIADHEPRGFAVRDFVLRPAA